MTKSSVLILGLVLFACGSNRGVTDAKPADTESTPKLDANGCVAPEEGAVRSDQVCVRTLAATVTGLDGAPVPSLVTTACGDGCTFGKTDASGRTRMEVQRYMSKAALMLHGRSKWASYYVRFEGGGDVDKGTLFLPAMPIDKAIAFPDTTTASRVTFGDVTLSFAAGTDIHVDRVELDEPELQKLAAVAVPLDKSPPFVADAGGGFAAVYAFTPYATRIT